MGAEDNEMIITKNYIWYDTFMVAGLHLFALTLTKNGDIPPTLLLTHFGSGLQSTRSRFPDDPRDSFLHQLFVGRSRKNAALSRPIAML